MQFNSVEYGVFLALAATVYFLIPYRWRWLLLLISSYIFYASWKPQYLVLIWASTIVDYCAGIVMGRTESRRSRAMALAGSLTINLGLLAAFKYFTFFADSLSSALAYAGFSFTPSDLDIVLPVGISFYTFQTLAYTIEVYRGAHPPERHLGRFALYVAFFPQLVAGPIERSSRLLPQLSRKIDFDYDRIVEGLRLILWGLFKKVVVADRLALMVNSVYAQPGETPGPVLATATIFFAFQIYCDFSGYCDIAIGSARIFGIDLMINFNRPYAARSIDEFWGRWHISLTTWFRDYLYIPLGGNRVSIPRHYANVVIVFAVSGLWHGANWTFVIWGLYHAAYYLVSNLCAPLRLALLRSSGLYRIPIIHQGLRWAITFTLVCGGWIFFRSATLADAIIIWRGLPHGWPTVFSADALDMLARQLGTSPVEMTITVLCGVAMIICESRQRLGFAPNAVRMNSMALRWAVYATLILSMFRFGVIDEVPFIYFQF
jgi:D-alanyl-lipoteichoic acid acyltransferase DltB (MBOAT superfamily)